MKKFNITTTCISEKHYMVDTSKKLAKIEEMIDEGMYFTINRARQYGKTTTMSRLFLTLQYKYIIIPGSIEGFGEEPYKSEQKFAETFLEMIGKRVITQDKEMSDYIRSFKKVKDMDELSEIITKICTKSQKEIVLMIDEVDKASNNIIFLDFLATLRDKYNSQKINIDKTFKSVILAGVHDVKNLKMHINERRILTEDEVKLLDKTTYNSPWNVAEDFDVDMSFNKEEIATMLNEYEEENKIGMDIGEISEEIYKYTSGYPFLVSKICKVIDEKLDKIWIIESVEQAVKIILKENNTLFESLIKNLENNRKLYEVIYEVIVNGVRIGFNIHNQVQSKAAMYGIIKSENDRVKVQNIIFEKLIYNYMISNRETSSKIETKYADRNKFVNSGILDMELILDKFQELMMQEYREKDEDFIEKKGRLIFLAFIKPIINGVGDYFIEPEMRDNKKMDIVIKYGIEKYIVELKIWRGEKYE